MSSAILSLPLFGLLRSRPRRGLGCLAGDGSLFFFRECLSSGVATPATDFSQELPDGIFIHDCKYYIIVAAMMRLFLQLSLTP